MLFRDRAEVRLGTRRTPYTVPASLLGVPYPLGLSRLIQIDLRLSGEKIRLRRNLASVTPHITCGRFYISTLTGVCTEMFASESFDQKAVRASERTDENGDEEGRGQIALRYSEREDGESTEE